MEQRVENYRVVKGVMLNGHWLHILIIIVYVHKLVIFFFLLMDDLTMFVSGYVLDNLNNLIALKKEYVRI